MTQPEYFPIGKLGEKKRVIYDAIQSIGNDGGLERKSVLMAMDTYAEEYQLEKTIEAFHNQPLEFYSPSKKAKEKALDAAIKNKPHYVPPPFGQSTIAGPPVYDLVKEAEKIFQWLIEEPKTSNQ